MKYKTYIENYKVRSFTKFALYFGLLNKKIRLCCGIRDIRCGNTPCNNLCGRSSRIVAIVRRKCGCHEVLCMTAQKYTEKETCVRNLSEMCCEVGK